MAFNAASATNPLAATSGKLTRARSFKSALKVRADDFIWPALTVKAAELAAVAAVIVSVATVVSLAAALTAFKSATAVFAPVPCSSSSMTYWVFRSVAIDQRGNAASSAKRFDAISSNLRNSRSPASSRMASRVRVSRQERESLSKNSAVATCGGRQ